MYEDLDYDLLNYNVQMYKKIMHLTVLFNLLLYLFDYESIFLIFITIYYINKFITFKFKLVQNAFSDYLI